MTAPIQLVQALPATATEAILYAASSTGAGQLVHLADLTLAEVEALLGGTLEVVQLDAQTCLLTNAQAPEQHAAKNLPASQRWFARNPESGAAADFIRGAAILCQTTQITHLNHLQAEVKPILSARERADRAVARTGTYQEAKLACSIANPEGCEMCGS